MFVRQFFDAPTSTFTYLLVDEASNLAILIDPVFEQHARDLALVRELGVELVMTLETHVHADHVTGSWLLRRAIGSKIVLAKESGAEGADHYVRPSEKVRAGSIVLEVLPTPGHTAGCVSYWEEKERMVFTGDALLIRGAGRTDFQEGNASQLFHSVRDVLFALPDDTLVYPAHDYSGRSVTTIGEEKQHNPRLGMQVREADFVGYMDHLGLPHPKKLAVAVPANLKVGEPGPGWGQDKNELPSWGPVVRTYAGVLQVEPDWVRMHQHEVVLLDVREKAEIESSPLGSLPGSVNEPLSSLRERVAEIPHDRPIITTCPAGARSAMAATILEQAGAPQVANLRGGILEWSSLGFPVEGTSGSS